MKDLNNYKISNYLEDNINMIQKIFNDDNTIILHRFENQYNSLKCCIFYIEGMVDINIINENILLPILNNKVLLDEIDYASYLSAQVLISSSVKISMDMKEIVHGIVTGDTVLFIEACSKAILINTKGWKARSVEESTTEITLKGPKEGFTESLITNLSLIRRKISTKDLKFHYIRVGKRTNTKVCVCYIEGLAEEDKICELVDKIESINIDGILDVKYIQEFIKDQPFSLFETTNSTEKPDVVSARLLEGRIAVIVDGSPTVMTAPTMFVEYMMSSDDYYLSYLYGTIARILRFSSFVITISVPALYLSLVTFHHETIPTHLLISIYTARQGVPFPSFFELVLLLIVFECLREAGNRVPGPTGQAISIVGALVLGTAAVDARFVSAPMIIIVGLSSITGLMLPTITSALIILKLGLLILSSFLGIYGYIFGVLALLIHLYSLRSLGAPFMGSLDSLKMQSIKDTFIRAPWPYMIYRPKFTSKNSRRSSNGGKGDV